MRCLALLAVLLWPLQPLDDAVRDVIQHSRGPLAEPVMRGASDAGRPALLLGLLVGVACFTGPAGPVTVREVLVALVGTNLAVEGLKRATFRARPDGEHKRSNAAFPSSHSANAFALAWVLGRRWRRLRLPLLAVAALVAYSRLYLNRHWLSDVLAGSAIGLACALAAGRWFARRAGLPPESDRMRA